MREYYHKELNKLVSFVKPDIVWKNSICDMDDVQVELKRIRRLSKQKTRLLITYYNQIWEPVLNFASFLGFRKKVGIQNWLDENDINNLCELSNWEIITSQKRFLFPPLIGWVVARPINYKQRNYSVSIIIPARNEAGNIKKILKKIPKFGRSKEIIFVEGNSTDDTWEEIKKLKGVKCFKQKGKGKGDAVRLGFSKATGEILMILDADMTVDPKELTKFYDAIITGKGEFINGCRLVYPMEKQAMQTLNRLGNMLFGWLFTWILGQRFKDTLCGTKVLFKEDYKNIVKNRKFFGNFDPFGDFDLIFGAIKLNLKVVEIPIRYKERTYGTTNISRFKHGLLLAKMTLIAFVKFKIW